ncbi:hypothetical protein KJ652_04390 [Patescibacteria group bacterium]|nr:hypothetical protein [Patescibacteria group bacterium]MBU1123806.1 hypothetical protein [Patescibacteria group bacterium]MBU1911699.1 hypothetical protein [Patescibacteria group bacterium]
MREANTECGVYAIFDYRRDRNLIQDAYEGALELGHRGQHACGIGFITLGIRENTMNVIHHNGPIDTMVDKLESVIALPETRAAFGHTQYRTSGKHDTELAQDEKDPCSAQPMLSPNGSMALIWNGNIANFENIKLDGEEVDTQTLMRLIIEGMRKSNRVTMEEIMKDAFKNVEHKAQGAFNIVVMHKGDPQRNIPPALFAQRDRFGTRPLGYTLDNGRLIVYSEDCALPSQDSYRHNVPPGHMIHSMGLYPEPIKIITPKTKHCFFEWVYFSHVKSKLDGTRVSTARHESGKYLAELDKDNFGPQDPDVIVVPVPDSARATSSSYANELMLLENTDAITRNPEFKGRQFIEQRKKGDKHIVNRKEVKGKKVILVEDSFVRGDTIQALIKDLRAAGAKEIHLRIACPPILGTCYKGIDIRTVEELFIPKLFDYNVPEFDENGCLPLPALDKIAEALNVDSIKFLPIQDVPKALLKKFNQLCMSCVFGKPECYRTKSERELVQLDLEKVRNSSE